jgi:hypothetical protein
MKKETTVTQICVLIEFQFDTQHKSGIRIHPTLRVPAQGGWWAHILCLPHLIQIRDRSTIRNTARKPPFKFIHMRYGVFSYSLSELMSSYTREIPMVHGDTETHPGPDLTFVAGQVFLLDLNLKFYDYNLV